jgi:uncharacterized protein
MKAVGFLCAPLWILTMVLAMVTPNLTGWASAQTRTETFVSIGSGEQTALYYPVAKAICQVVFRELLAQGIRCSAEATPGSAYNVGTVLSGELEFGIVQSDILFTAYNGIGRWDGKPVTELRTVLSLYPELVTIVARADANIHVLSELAGKQVSVGSVATGPRTTWDLISASLDLTPSVRLTELRQDEMASALCDRTVDANFFVVGHPSELVSKWLTACPSNLVAIREAVVDKLVSTYPFYTRGFIPTELYQVPDKILSVGPVATLVTSASINPRVVAAIAKSIVTNIAELRTAHPALAELDAEKMVAQSLNAPAPLHPAAAAVYKELGYIK